MRLPASLGKTLNKFSRLTRCRHTAPGNAEEEEHIQALVATLWTMAFKGYAGCSDGGMAGIFTWVGAQKASQMV